MLYRVLADLMLLVHFSYVAFVVVGLLLIVVGVVCRWQWVRNFWFRAAHLTAIAIVVGESWAGITCPLTTWEHELRLKSGGASYQGDFVAHWIENAMFFRAEPWVFTLGYSVFGALVLATFVFGAPRRPGNKGKTHTK